MAILNLVRRAAFGALVLVGVAVAVGLVLWLAILSLNHASPSAAATVGTNAVLRHTAVPLHAATIPTAAGTTCFVAGQGCSRIPCNELIRSTVSVAKATRIAPSVRRPRLETPMSGCGSRRSLPHATIVARRGPRHGLMPYSALLGNTAHQLTAHPPARP
jgi:hypothetical protein